MTPNYLYIVCKFPLCIGYSLGGGLAQLMALDCKLGKCAGVLPSNAAITVIGFGSPPVFTSEVIPQLDNLILVTNNEDAMSGASLKNIHDVADQLCVVKHLNLRRRDMIKMLFSSSDESEDQKDFELLDKFGEDYKQDSDDKSLMQIIGSSIQNMMSDSPEPEMYHLASKLLALRRKPDRDNDAISVTTHNGLNETNILTRELNILNRNMILDHLPDRYTDLFRGYGQLSDHIDINKSKMEQLFHKQNENQKIKPKSKWKRFKTNVKEFFKGLG